MSFSQLAKEAVDSIIHSYIEKIANKKLSKKELYELWCNSVNSDEVVKKGVVKKEVVKKEQVKEQVKHVTTSTPSEQETELKGMKKPELVEICKSQNLKRTGTKAELIARIIEASGGTVSDTGTKTSAKTSAKTNSVKSVTKKLLSKAPSFAIRRNNFGNYVHPESKLVFNNKTQEVIGVQNEDGTIDDLTPEDIDTCNKFKFKYVLPENLDKKVSFKDVKVEELEEEEVEEIIEEEEGEEEIIEEEEIIDDEEEDVIEEELIADDDDEVLGEDEEYEYEEVLEEE